MWTKTLTLVPSLRGLQGLEAAGFVPIIAAASTLLS
jgi:hypothetical protein